MVFRGFLDDVESPLVGVDVGATDAAANAPWLTMCTDLRSDKVRAIDGDGEDDRIDDDDDDDQEPLRWSQPAEVCWYVSRRWLGGVSIEVVVP